MLNPMTRTRAAAAGPVTAPAGSDLPRPVSPRASARLMYLLRHLLEPNPGYRWLASWPRRRRLFTGGLLRLRLPIDHRLWGERSWIRYWQGRDEGLWTETRGWPSSGRRWSAATSR